METRKHVYIHLGGENNTKYNSKKQEVMFRKQGHCAKGRAFSKDSQTNFMRELLVCLLTRLVKREVFVYGKSALHWSIFVDLRLNLFHD